MQNKFSKFHRLWLIALVGILLLSDGRVASSAYAQSDSIPLLNLLEKIPNTLNEYIDYANYQGLLNIEGSIQINSVEAAQKLMPKSPEHMRLWATLRVASQSFWDEADAKRLVELKEKTGIDLFKVQQQLALHGNNTGFSYAFQMPYDKDLFITYIKSVGYTPDSEYGTAAWCDKDGCDKKHSLEPYPQISINGFFLERTSPLVLKDDLIFDVSDVPLIPAFVAGPKSNMSLANDPAIRAAVKAFASKGNLLDAVFLNAPIVYDYFDWPKTRIPAAKAALDAGIKALQENFVAIPDYDLAAAGYLFDPKASVFRSIYAIVYDQKNEVATVAKALETRLRTYRSFYRPNPSPMIRMFESLGGTLAPYEIYTDTETGKSVILFSFDSPKAEETPFFQNAQRYMTPSIEVYEALKKSLAYRDSYWLSRISP